jgi:hypothetical protein
MSSPPTAPAQEAAASLAALSKIPGLPPVANLTNPNEVVCGAGSFCTMRGFPLSSSMKHLCAECGESTHGFHCAYHIRPDRQEDNRDGVVVNASLLSQKARDECQLGNATMLCIPCYKTTHENESIVNAASTDGVNLAAATAPTASSKTDPDMLKNIYNLDHVEVTTQKTNSTVAVKQGKLPEASKCTRLKGFQRSSNGAHHCHTVAEVSLQQLQKFATAVGVKGQRKGKKVDVCEAIVEKKAARDRALLTGEEEVIDEHGEIVKLNRVRVINVLTSSEFRPYLLKELTDNIKANEKVMDKFVELYNSNNPKFAKVHYEGTGIVQDPSQFTQLPASYWKTALKAIKKLGKVKYIGMTSIQHIEYSHLYFVIFVFPGV